MAISFQSHSYLERTVRLQSSISRLDEEPQEVQSVLGQQETQGVLCCPQDPKACANERRCRKNLYKDRSIDPTLHRMQLLANELREGLLLFNASQQFFNIISHQLLAASQLQTLQTKAHGISKHHTFLLARPSGLESARSGLPFWGACQKMHLLLRSHV